MSKPSTRRAVLICIDFTYYEVSEKEAVAILKALNSKTAYHRNYDKSEHGGPDYVPSDREGYCNISIETGTIGPKPFVPMKAKPVLSITHRPPPKQLPSPGLYRKGGDL